MTSFSVKFYPPPKEVYKTSWGSRFRWFCFGFIVGGWSAVIIWAFSP